MTVSPTNVATTTLNEATAIPQLAEGSPRTRRSGRSPSGLGRTDEDMAAVSDLDRGESGTHRPEPEDVRGPLTLFR
jgi:hypothetical protein